MIALFLISFVPTLVGGGSRQSRVVGGLNAQEGEFPFAVYIRSSSSACTGSIIHPSNVLTAAHCVRRSGPSREYMVVAGATDVEFAKYKDVGQVRYSVHTMRHPDYQDFKLSHDIAVIKIDEPFELNETIQLLPLSSKEWPQTNDHLVRCIAAGWGKTKDMRKEKLLQKLWVTAVHGYRVCPKVHGFMEKRIICLKRQINKGVCMGDSGGALICDGLGVGVASSLISRVTFAERVRYTDDLCGHPDYQDVYTFICPYLSWLSDQVPNIPKTPKSCRATKIYAGSVLSLALTAWTISLITERRRSLFEVTVL